MMASILIFLHMYLPSVSQDILYPLMYHTLLCISHALLPRMLPAAIGEFVFAMIILAYSTLPEGNEIAKPTQNPVDLHNFHPLISLTMAACSVRGSTWSRARKTQFTLPM
eukprot:scaffold41963_cov67-Attheya_sp.AAC.5